MTNFKGTKGKWKVFTEFEEFESVESDNMIICNTIQKGELDKYNAKLIACAPEMLEMLESLINESDEIIHPEIKKDILNIIKKATDE